MLCLNCEALRKVALIECMGLGGVGVCPVPCNQRVVGSNLHQAAA